MVHVMLLCLLLCFGPVQSFLIPESCDTMDCKLNHVLHIVSNQQVIMDQQSRQIVALQKQLSVMSCTKDNTGQNQTEPGTTTKGAHKTQSVTSGPQTTIPSFYAVKSRDQRDLAKGERIMFETAITNVFKAYDIYSGVFKVPLKGAYAFTWTIAMNNIDNHACFSLLVNNVVVGQTYLWNNGSDAVSTGFSVVEVNSGDDVYMSVCNVSQPLGEIVSDVYRKTSFAGWCIACVG